MAHVRQAVLMDAIYLAPNMRLADVREISRSGNKTPLHALVLPFTDPSSQTYSMVGDAGTILGMFGISADGVVWMLASDSLYANHKRQFIKECRQWVDVMQADHEIIHNFVDEENTVAIRWLQFLGFEVEEHSEPYGYQQRPFKYFYRRRKPPDVSSQA